MWQCMYILNFESTQQTLSYSFQQIQSRIAPLHCAKFHFEYGFVMVGVEVPSLLFYDC